MATSTKNTPLLPVYLVAGKDELKQRRVVEKLHERLSKEGDLSFNSDYFSGETAKGDDIVAACNTLPFASTTRLVQVANADRLKKAGIDALVDYLKNPSNSTVLLLLAKTIAKNSRLAKAVSALSPAAFIDCAPFAKKDLNNAVRTMAKQTHRVELTQGAVAALIDLVGDDMLAIDENLKKIALAHRGEDPVSDGEVYSLVARTAKLKWWDFVDAFSARNISRCLLVFARLEKGVTSYALLGNCVTRIRELIRVKSYEQRGEISRLATVLKLPDWRIRNLRRDARNFSTAELIHALVLARQCEQDAKTGRDPNVAFLEWVVGVLKP